MSNSYIARASKIATRVLGTETLIMSAADSTIFTLNEVGSVIWEAADGQTPLRQIVENSGVEASIVVGKLLEQKSNTFGFDAQNEKYVDLVEAGIVDPTKVVRTALQNAASVAGLLLTTEAMVAEKPEEKKGPAMPPGGGGMDMM